jgi:type II secretory pathway pseudopilin PulG
MAARQSVAMTVRGDTQSGFTLVETLVAFVILSGTIIIALSTMSGGLHSMQRSAEIMHASRVAQTVLDSVLANSGSDVGSIGEMEGFKWQIRIEPIQSRDDAAMRPVFIRIDILDATGQAIPQAGLDTIAMLRLKP